MATEPHADDEGLWSEDDPELPQEADLKEDDADSDTVPCPECGHEISDLAEQCPHCHAWVVAGTGPKAGPNWWFVGTVLIAAIALFLWLVR